MRSLSLHQTIEQVKEGLGSKVFSKLKPSFIIHPDSVHIDFEGNVSDASLNRFSKVKESELSAELKKRHAGYKRELKDRKALRRQALSEPENASDPGFMAQINWLVSNAQNRLLHSGIRHVLRDVPGTINLGTDSVAKGKRLSVDVEIMHGGLSDGSELGQVRNAILAHDELTLNALEALNLYKLLGVIKRNAVIQPKGDVSGALNVSFRVAHGVANTPGLYTGYHRMPVVINQDNKKASVTFHIDAFHLGEHRLGDLIHVINRNSPGAQFTLSTPHGDQELDPSNLGELLHRETQRSVLRVKVEAPIRNADLMTRHATSQSELNERLRRISPYLTMERIHVNLDKELTKDEALPMPKGVVTLRRRRS